MVIFAVKTVKISLNNIKMKQIKTYLVGLLLAFACVATMQAQSFSYGVVAGMNLTKLKLSGSVSDAVAYSSDNKAGWYIGPKVALNTVIGLGFDASLQYSQRKLSITQENTVSQSTQNKTYRTIEIPVNIRYNIGLGKIAGVYVSTGPQFGFALQNMSWSNVGNNFDRSNMNTTWNIGAGVRLLGHLEVGLGYNFALGSAGKILGDYEGTSTDSELKYKTNTFQVQVAYMF